MDLLYDAAVAWERLTKNRYHFIYGKKKKLIDVKLEFEKNEFYHVAGFPHLNDLSWTSRFPQSRAIDKVVDGTITESFICKSANYENVVKPKLLAIVQLESFLDDDFKTFLFNKNKVPFTSAIEAEFLLSNSGQSVVFLFTDEDQDGTYYTRSTFVMGDRDFTKNQTPITILFKSREDLTSGTKIVLYDKLNKESIV